MIIFSINASGAMWSPNLVQVTESISGSVVSVSDSNNFVLFPFNIDIDCVFLEATFDLSCD